jgi:hypothetical protein
MNMRRARRLTCACLLLLFLVPASGLGGRSFAAADAVADAAFWRMFSDFSEPSGFFQSDNLVSNELTFPNLLPEIANRNSEQGAYVGVGPEQNFSYLAALKPRIAFIVDIRRQNAILHLLYKALFELSASREEFLSRLLSRPRPRHLNARSSVADLFAAFAAAPAEASRFEKNLKEVKKQLQKKHGFALTEEDLAALQYVYSAFFEAGPGLQYSFGSSRRGRPFPTFAELMTAVDAQGSPRSFLATDADYQVLRDLQRRNLIIPVVGNFGGGKALKSVASHLSARGFTVNVFYTSNVESYLFRSEDWRGFYDNLSTLPVDRKSVLVRSIFGRYGFGGPPLPGATPQAPVPGRSESLHLDPIEDLVAAFLRGEISSYDDLIARSK